MRPTDDAAVRELVVGSVALVVGWVLLRLVRKRLGSWFEYVAAAVIIGSIVIGEVAYYSGPGPRVICTPQGPPPLQTCVLHPAATR